MSLDGIEVLRDVEAIDVGEADEAHGGDIVALPNRAGTSAEHGGLELELETLHQRQAPVGLKADERPGGGDVDHLGPQGVAIPVGTGGDEGVEAEARSAIPDVRLQHRWM